MRRRAVLFLTLGFMIFVGVAAWGDGLDIPEAQTEVSMRVPRAGQKSGKPTAGDVIEMKVTPPQGMSDALPTVGEKVSKEGVLEWGSGRILKWIPYDAASNVTIFWLTAYSPGKFEIPSITFQRDGKNAFQTQKSTVEFTSVGGDKSIDDIYPPESVGFPQWVWIALSIVVLGLTICGLWWLARWSQKKRKLDHDRKNAPRILNAQESFEKTRAETEAKKYLESERFKPHYFALSEAAKRFIGEAYRFDAEERTTRELVRELEAIGMSNELVDQWAALFDEMDVTKFTDKKPEAAFAKSLSARLSQAVTRSYRVSPAAKEALALSMRSNLTPEAKR